MAHDLPVAIVSVAALVADRAVCAASVDGAGGGGVHLLHCFSSFYSVLFKRTMLVKKATHFSEIRSSNG